MIYHDRIDVSLGIDINKTSASKERNFCHYCHFLDRGFKFQPCVCNGFHDVLMMSINLIDIAVLKICWIIAGLSPTSPKERLQT